MTGIGFRLRRSPEKVDLIAEKSLAAQNPRGFFLPASLPAARRCQRRSAAGEMSLISHAHIEQLIHAYGLWVVFAAVIAESMGVPMPGETTVVAAGLFAGSTHQLNPYLLVGIAATAAVVGDNIGYAIGRTLGLRLLLRYGRHVGLTEAHLKLGRYLFMRHGGKIVFLGRFIALLRTFAALLAGANEMPWLRFSIFNALGGLCWAALFGFGAYAFGEEVAKVAGPFAGFMIAAAVTIGSIGVLYLRRHEQELQERVERMFPGPLQY
jgi:membrane protein DedA with SNARE-associated domain